MEKLIIEHNKSGVFFYKESLDHHKKTEVERKEAGLIRRTLEDLAEECRVSEGEYLVIDLPNQKSTKKVKKKGKSTREIKKKRKK